MTDPVVLSPTIQTYAGIRWYLCGFYFQHRHHGRLHRRVWTDHHGPIPPGYHVHHDNHDATDNRVANLVLRPGREHVGEHAAQPSDKARAARRRNVRYAVEGNARLTPEQRAAAARRGWVNATTYTIACEVCGREFETYYPNRTRFCGGTCRARVLRARRRAAAQEDNPL